MAYDYDVLIIGSGFGGSVSALRLTTVAANLGVNPSLTITALAERAVARWPNAGEQDARPALGEPYERIDPVRPHSPVVPSGAPAALRLGSFGE
jgi:cholesterol oxidase